MSASNTTPVPESPSSSAVRDTRPIYDKNNPRLPFDALDKKCAKVFMHYGDCRKKYFLRCYPRTYAYWESKSFNKALCAIDRIYQGQHEEREFFFQEAMEELEIAREAELDAFRRSS